MSGGGASRACFLILVMFSAAFSGCFGESGETGINSDRDVVVTPETLSGGVFQPLTITAKSRPICIYPILDTE